MHYAVRTSSSYMIKILLLYNVDINLQDKVCFNSSLSSSFMLFIHWQRKCYFIHTHLQSLFFPFLTGWLDAITSSCSIPPNRYSEASVNKES